MINRILRIMMVVALLTGYCGDANAQFGGLLNAAKKKGQDILNKEAQKTKGNEGDATDEDDVRLYFESNKLLGVWHAKRRVLEKYGTDSNGNQGSQLFIFKEDGSVTAEDGRRIGEILPDGTMNCGQTQDITFNQQTGEVKHKGDWVGTIDNNGGMYMFNEKMAHAVKPMDRQILCYLLFNIICTNEMLEKYKKEYAEAVKRSEEKRQQQIANAKASMEASRHEGAGVQLYKGGSVAGEIRSNNEVWIGGSNRGKFDSNGNIWVGGSVKGQILSDGQIRKGGSIVGKVESGKVWIGGSVVGEIRSNGDVVKGGSVIGRAPGMRDARQVAVIYFFGFFAL